MYVHAWVLTPVRYWADPIFDRRGEASSFIVHDSLSAFC